MIKWQKGAIILNVTGKDDKNITFFLLFLYFLVLRLSYNSTIHKDQLSYRVQCILYLKMHQVETFNPQAIPAGVAAPDVCDIPCEITYFFIVPQPPCLDYNNIKAHVITFRSHLQTFQSLMEDYFQEFKPEKSQPKNFCFSLGNRFKLDPSLSMRDLQKMLGRQKLDGVVLYLIPFKVVNKGKYEEQCCILDYFGDQKGSKFSLRFNLSLDGCSNSEFTYVECHPLDSGEEAMTKLADTISLEYGLANMNFKRIYETYIINPDNIHQQAKLQRYKRLIEQQIYNRSVINIKITNPNNEKLKRVNKFESNSLMLIFNEDSSSSIQLGFDEIANLTFADFYDNLLRNSASPSTSVVHCLKVMDLIIKPEEKIGNVKEYFKDVKMNEYLSIAGKVINEKMIFFEVVPSISKQKSQEFRLNELIIPQNQKDKREECDIATRKRAQRAQKDYFKVPENVEPILIYTSQLKYHQPTTKKQAKIYQSLNKYLRENPILSLNEDYSSKDWRWRFASTLLKHLQHAQIFKGKVWRGIDYNPKIKEKDKGSIFTFKPFTSTSKNMETAFNFAKSFRAIQPYHVFAFEVKNGRNIQQYSLIQQGEVLLQPYTEFQLINVTETVIDDSKFIMYEMQERETKRQLPPTKASFIIWIDDQSREPEKVYNKIKMLATQSTIYERLYSTTQLQAWLKKHDRLMTDGTANILFVTNMVRQQRDKLNEIAGVEGALMVRKYSQRVPIFFYVRSIEESRKKIVTHNLGLANMIIGERLQQLQAFLQGFV